MREEEKKQGAPEWITTFADMMSLLLTFFVFILTFSTIEVEKYKKARGSILGAMGIAPRDSTPLELSAPVKTMRPPNDPTDPGAENEPEELLEEIVENVALAVRKVTDQDEPFKMSEFPDGIRILPGEGVFEPSSTLLTVRWRRMILNVADVLVPFSRRVLVRGFTDNQFLPTVEYPSAAAMEVARAARVAEVLVEGGMPPEQIQITQSAVPEYPYPNDSPRSRARNRTFEMRVVNAKDPSK